MTIDCKISTSIFLLLLSVSHSGCLPAASSETQSTKITTEQSAAEKFNIAARVHALGRLEPDGTVLSLAAPSGNEGNVVAQMLVAEGQDVDENQLLAVMDTHGRRKAAVQEAEAQILAAKARLKQLRAAPKISELEASSAFVSAAESEVLLREREARRLEALHRQGAETDSRADDARLALKAAQDRWREAQARRAALSEVRTADCEVIEAEIRVAESRVEMAKANLLATELRSPIKGRVLRIHCHVLEQVQSPGILEIAQVQHMQAVAEIYEGDVGRVKVGQRATVFLDSSPQHFAGRVAKVGHSVSRKSILTNDPISDTDARVVEVRIDLENAQELSGLSHARVQVQIAINGYE